ncbi:hypothetical protein Q9L58_004726 [Maublancomyces gigas]|uniref:Uncharacterized protein n=1 Tax=Discina gigas TaxID=1032678 RepID=A0ABR3GK22_9PEZI
MYASNRSYNKLLIGLLLALSRLACARVSHYDPHHRHRRHIEVGLVGGISGNAAVVEGPPNDAVVSVAPPPNNAVVPAVLLGIAVGAVEVVGAVVAAAVGAGAEIIGSVVEQMPTKAVDSVVEQLPATAVYSVVEQLPTTAGNSIVESLPTTGPVGGEITSAITDILAAPLPTTVAETPSEREIDMSSTSALTASADPTTSHTSTLTNPSVSTNPAVPAVASYTGTSTLPTTVSTAETSSTKSSSDPASTTTSVAPGTTSAETSDTTSSAIPSSSKSKSKTQKPTTRAWSTLQAPSSIKTVTSTSASTSPPTTTRIPTEKQSTIELSFQMPSFSSRKPTPTYVIDLSTFPANVSANAPCYNENCSNPDSGMNYRTKVSVTLDKGLLSAGTAGKSVYTAAALVCALWGAVVLL